MSKRTASEGFSLALAEKLDKKEVIIISTADLMQKPTEGAVIVGQKMTTEANRMINPGYATGWNIFKIVNGTVIAVEPTGMNLVLKKNGGFKFIPFEEVSVQKPTITRAEKRVVRKSKQVARKAARNLKRTSRARRVRRGSRAKF